jgi:hypothetical protein
LAASAYLDALSDKYDDEFWELSKRKLDVAGPGFYLEKSEKLKQMLFPKQLQVFNDPSRKKVARCSRRAGKSYFVSSKGFYECMRRPGSFWLYLAVSGPHARKILWDAKNTGVKHLHSELGLKDHVKFNEQRLTVDFPELNSTFMLGGAGTREEMDKWRGIAPDGVIIDEPAAFRPHILTELIHDVISPALADSMGELLVVGTPGTLGFGEWFDASCPTSPGFCSRPYEDRDKEVWKGKKFVYSLHHWTSEDNTAKPWIREEHLAEAEARGWGPDHPSRIIELDGHWCLDDSGMVYAYQASRDSWTPDENSTNPFGLNDDHEWSYILGMDMGFEDDFAMVIWAYSPSSPNLYHVYDWSKPKLLPQDIARKVQQVKSQFRIEFDAMVGDTGGYGKGIVEILNRNYGFYIEAAQKSSKRDYIDLINGDIIAGRVKILKGSDLAQQMMELPWDDTGLREDPRFKNHATDAALYAWRYCYHQFWRPPSSTPTPGSREEAKMLEKAEISKAIAEEMGLDEQDWMTSEFGDFADGDEWDDGFGGDQSYL